MAPFASFQGVRDPHVRDSSIPPRRAPPPKSTSRRGRRTHGPRTARTARITPHRACEEAVHLGSLHTACEDAHVARQHGPAAPPGPRTGGCCHLKISKGSVYRMLSRQEEIFPAPRGAVRRAPDRESPTVRSVETGNLSRTSKMLRLSLSFRAAFSSGSERDQTGDDPGLRGGALPMEHGDEPRRFPPKFRFKVKFGGNLEDVTAS